MTKAWRESASRLPRSKARSPGFGTLRILFGIAVAVGIVLGWNASSAVAIKQSELGASSYTYDASILAYDAVLRSAHAHGDDLGSIASDRAVDGVSDAAVAAIGSLSLVSGFGVAAKTETTFTRFTVSSSGETTLNLRLGSGSVEVSEHAALRMAERGISIDSAEAALTQSPFQYTLDGVVRMGYYDPVSRVFVGTVDETVTTVIGNVKPQYIENLKAG